MVQVKQYEVNRITGYIDVVISYKHNGVYKDDAGTYTTEAAARANFHSLQKTVFLQHLDRYVNDEKYIIESGKYKNQFHKQESLDVCERYADWANRITGSDPMLSEICDFGLKIRTHLERILPPESDPGYMNARERLAEIIAFCSNYKESLKQLQAVSVAA